MRFFLKFFLLNFVCVSLCADPLFDGFAEGTSYTPWFTGPIFVPAPTNADPRHPVLQPAAFFVCTYGTYGSDWKVEKQQNKWTISPQLYLDAGFTEKLGIELVAAATSNFQGGRTSTHFQDTILLLGYQISNDEKDSWVPDFRIMIQETFPTGKYQKLKLENQGIDSTGQGSFQTGPAFAMRKIFTLSGQEFSLYWSAGYLFPTMVDVKGLNAFGGASDTKGKVRPGQGLFNFISGEYSITQNWVFAFDTVFFLQRKSHFSGTRGSTQEVNLPLTFQFSVAPEVEYNFSANAGLIAGVWFSAFGKNSSAFAGAVFSYVYTF